MEVVTRAFYAAKQFSLGISLFAGPLPETALTKMNPRFRIITALAYGTSRAVNSGKIYITRNILKR